MKGVCNRKNNAFKKRRQRIIHYLCASRTWKHRPSAWEPNVGAKFILADIPGHALHEKGLQRQKGVGPLVSSQEHRALLVLRINRGSTAGFVPPPVYIGFPLFVLPRGCSGQLFSIPWRTRGTVVPCAEKPVGVPSCRARRAQPPRCAPDLPLVRPGFEFDRSG